MLDRICVFCGSSPGTNPIYLNAARRLGELLSERNIGLVYGGSNAGLMGALADACLRSGGRVTGVIPTSLVEKEIAHRGLTELHIVGSMHERKALMADLADAFIALPGGFGTWDEFCEVLTWSQLGIHRKACGLLNINGYYDPFLAMADRALQDGFLRAPHRKMMLAEKDPACLLELLHSYSAPVADKWVENSAR